MLLNRFSQILAEKRIRITQAGIDTGLSRTTLTALAKNSGVGVNYETIDKLCIYLEVTPGEFFEFYPADVTIESTSDPIEEIDELEVKCLVKFTEKNFEYYLQLKGDFDSRFSFEAEGRNVENDDNSLLIGSLFLDPEFKENETALKYLKEFPPGIIEDLKSMITLQVASDLLTERNCTWSTGRVIFDYKK